MIWCLPTTIPQALGASDHPKCQFLISGLGSHALTPRDISPCSYSCICIQASVPTAPPHRSLPKPPILLLLVLILPLVLLQYNLWCRCTFEFNTLKVGNTAVNFFTIISLCSQMAPGVQLELAEGRAEEILPPNERPVFLKNHRKKSNDLLLTSILSSHFNSWTVKHSP